MIWSRDRWDLTSRGAALAILCFGAATLALVLAKPFAYAQEGQAQPKSSTAPKPAPAAPAPAAPAPGMAPDAGAPTAAGAPGAIAVPTLSTATPGAPNGEPWVKLCMKNEQTQNKQVCLISHEGLEPNSGMVLVSATVRSAEGDDKQQLFIRLPTFQALVIPVGMQIKIDDKQPIPLAYTICFPMNCQAQIELTKDMMDSLRSGKQMMVAAMNFQQKTIAFPVPLTGFGKVLDGPPVDLAKYEESRKQLADVFRKKAEDAAKQAGGAPGAPPGVTGSMPPAGVPGAAPAPSAQAPANATTAQQKKPATPPTP